MVRYCWLGTVAGILFPLCRHFAGIFVCKCHSIVDIVGSLRAITMAAKWLDIVDSVCPALVNWDNMILDDIVFYPTFDT